MKSGLLITGAILLLIGFVWIGQGANLIGGSFMTGSSLWLKIGLAVTLVGGALVWWASVGHRRF